MTDFWRRRAFWLLVVYVIAYGIGFALLCGIAWGLPSGEKIASQDGTEA